MSDEIILAIGILVVVVVVLVVGKFRFVHLTLVSYATFKFSLVIYARIFISGKSYVRLW